MNPCDELIGAERFAVFGTGFVADMIMKAFIKNGSYRLVDCFLVTEKKTEEFYGLPVYNLKEYADKGIPVLIAVHSSNMKSVRDALDKNGFRKCLWAYPYLNELLYGPMIEERVISLSDLIGAQNPEHLWLASRVCGILYCSGKLEEGKGIYMKTMKLISRPETAERRLQQCKNLYDSFMSNGFDRSFPIVIDSGFRIIDGLHRISLCLRFNVDRIPAQIYPSSGIYEEIFKEDNLLPVNKLQELGFSNKEIQIMKETQKWVLRKATKNEY